MKNLVLENKQETQTDISFNNPTERLKNKIHRFLRKNGEPLAKIDSLFLNPNLDGGTIYVNYLDTEHLPKTAKVKATKLKMLQINMFSFLTRIDRKNVFYDVVIDKDCFLYDLKTDIKKIKIGELKKENLTYATCVELLEQHKKPSKLLQPLPANFDIYQETKSTLCFLKNYKAKYPSKLLEDYITDLVGELQNTEWEALSYRLQKIDCVRSISMIDIKQIKESVAICLCNYTKLLKIKQDAPQGKNLYALLRLVCDASISDLTTLNQYTSDDWE
jgi:hypothetical protein